MKVIKRDGHMVDFCPAKIEAAIMKANSEVEEDDQASSTQIKNIVKYIEKLGKKRILVEDIQDIIEREKFEKWLCKKSTLLERLCTKRGIKLWEDMYEQQSESN